MSSRTLNIGIARKESAQPITKQFTYACCTIDIKVNCVLRLSCSISCPARVLSTMMGTHSFDAQCTDSLVSLRQQYALIAWSDLNTIEDPRNADGGITLHNSTLNN